MNNYKHNKFLLLSLWMLSILTGLPGGFHKKSGYNEVQNCKKFELIKEDFKHGFPLSVAICQILVGIRGDFQRHNGLSAVRSTLFSHLWLCELQSCWISKSFPQICFLKVLDQTSSSDTFIFFLTFFFWEWHQNCWCSQNPLKGLQSILDLLVHIDPSKI